MTKDQVKDEVLRLVKNALQTGDVEGMIRDSISLSITEPETYAQVIAETSAQIVQVLLEFVRANPIEFRPLIVHTMWWVMETINQAKISDWDRYSDFANASKRELAFDVEMYRNLSARDFLAVERDLSNIGSVLKLFLDMLNTYKRRLAYLEGLVEVANGRAASIETICHRSTRVIETALRNACGPGRVLGDEYRHLRNALAHGNYRVQHGSGSLVFTDRSWRQEYDYPSFVATLQHARNWILGWTVGYEIQRLFTAKGVYIDPASFEREPEWILPSEKGDI